MRYTEYRIASIKRWNQTAIECYKIGCKCSECHLLDNLELTKDKCKMKLAVFELVRKLGAPDVTKNDYMEDDDE